MRDKKNILKSKTFWLNSIALAGAVLTELPVNEYTLGALSALNIGLRVVSGQPVTLFPKKK